MTAQLHPFPSPAAAIGVVYGRREVLEETPPWQGAAI